MIRTVISGSDKRQQELDNFKYASPDKQRFLIYTGTVNSTDRVIKYETDDKLCYFSETLRPRMGKVGFIQRSTRDGFTFDKTKKKLSVWFGKSLMKINSTLIEHMMSDLGQDWYGKMPYQLRIVTTRMLLEKIVKGKIISQAEYVESYVKHHLKLPVSPLKYESAVAKVSDIYKFNHVLRTSDNPAELVDDYDKYRGVIDAWDMGEITRACDILGVKFNWTVSPEEKKFRLDDMQHKIKALEKEYRLVLEFQSYGPEKVEEATNNLPF